MIAPDRNIKNIFSILTNNAYYGRIICTNGSGGAHVSKEALCSDMTSAERHLYLCGAMPMGEPNTLVGVLKLIGKYEELKEFGTEDQITKYSPNFDDTFQYENRGQILVKRRLGQHDVHISRDLMRHACRKWPLSRVKVTYYIVPMIEDMLAYIDSNPVLKKHCDDLFGAIDHNNIQQHIPIQYQFLLTRVSDHHVGHQIANRILAELMNIRR